MFRTDCYLFFFQMCPVSGFVQFLTVLVLLLLLCHRIVAQWTVNYQPLSDPIHMNQAVDVNYNLTGKLIEA